MRDLERLDRPAEAGRDGISRVWPGEGAGILSEWHIIRSLLCPLCLPHHFSLSLLSKCVCLCVQHEDALAQAAFEEARRRTRDFEDRDRSHREDLEVRPLGALFSDPAVFKMLKSHKASSPCPCFYPPRPDEMSKPSIHQSLHRHSSERKHKSFFHSDLNIFDYFCLTPFFNFRRSQRIKSHWNAGLALTDCVFFFFFFSYSKHIWKDFCAGKAYLKRPYHTVLGLSNCNQKYFYTNMDLSLTLSTP